MPFRRVLVLIGLACGLTFGVLADYSDEYVTVALGAGDPASDCANEPQPNGHRVNLGFYGNTPYATMSLFS